jgi:two-component system, NtrC family, response regulator AtoC
MSGLILLVDDDLAMTGVLGEALPAKGYQVLARASGEEALALLQTEDVDVVVTDLHMKGMSGLELCARIVANRPDVPVVVITAFGSLEAAIEAIRAGAYDFVTKPFEPKTLVVALDRAVQHRTLRQEVRRLREQIDRSRPLPDIVGDSAALRPVRDLIQRLVESDVSVLVTGESGTGKELVARALHSTGRRRSGPFVAVNCAALPESLLESELFGHVRGAFTDAKAPRAGLFVQAHGGTLFLDEVGEMPTALQAKLLRALQERRVRALGAEGETPIDVRLICATNRDLETAIEERRFREDLYFRINVVQIPLPSLRVRGNDVLLLAQHFVARFAAQTGKSVRGLSATAAEKLLGYAWPGNVRELQNAIERAVALTRFEEIAVDDLPDKLRRYQGGQVLTEGSDPAELVPLEEVERRYILRVLEAVGGRRSDAAKVLGIDRKTLYRKLDRWGYQDPAPG